jgi:putative hydrolase of the HAD superfamily
VIHAALFDLDDTLFPQRAWLDGAWAAVARAGGELGITVAPLYRALVTVAADGSDRGRIIDRALERLRPQVSVGPVDVARLVTAFRAYRSPRLHPYPGVAAALTRLRRTMPIALVTDGDVEIQASKLVSLGLESAFDAVVFSDDLGRDKRKPHPAPFREALTRLGCGPDGVVHIGDRPDKDVAGALRCGIRPVRVRTGEYRDRPDHPRPWASVRTVIDAIRLVESSEWRIA